MADPPHPFSLSHTEPVSNAERQRAFRERHPNYHRRYYVTAAQWRVRLAGEPTVSPPPAAAASDAGESFDPSI